MELFDIPQYNAVAVTIPSIVPTSSERFIFNLLFLLFVRAQGICMAIFGLTNPPIVTNI